MLSGSFRLVLLALLGLGLAAPALAQADSDDDAVTETTPANVTATGPYVVFDAATGEVIAAERAGEPWYPASLSKLMTAYVVFRHLRDGTLKLDQQIPVSALANGQPPSKIGLGVGKTITVDLALQTLLVYSANDMAYVLAEAASGSTVRFVAEMNGAAERLGLASTHFQNPNGLFDPRQLTSARDIGVLAAVLLAEFPEYQGYFAQPSVKVGARTLMNRNSLIRVNPEANGMKTGFVCNSGYNLVAAATHEGRRLIAVVLGATSGGNRVALAQKLLAQGFQTPAGSQATRVAQIADQPLGGLVPADMTSTVCRQKPVATLTSALDLGGWGVSFGIYDTALLADMALRGRMVGPVVMRSAGDGGVVQLPGKAGYAAMMWGQEAITSLNLCTKLRAEKAPCDVMPPTAFRQMALAAVAEQPPAPPPVVEGADSAKAKPAPPQRPKAKRTARPGRAKATPRPGQKKR